MTTTTCPDCPHPWAEHLHGLDDGFGSGCYHRLDRLDEDQAVDRPDHDGPKWCPCTNTPPVDLDATRPANLALATVAPAFEVIRDGFDWLATTTDVGEVCARVVADLTPAESEAGALLFPCMLSMGDRLTILRALQHLYPHLGERLGDTIDRLMSVPTPGDVATHAAKAAIEMRRHEVTR